MAEAEKKKLENRVPTEEEIIEQLMPQGQKAGGKAADQRAGKHVAGKEAGAASLFSSEQITAWSAEVKALIADNKLDAAAKRLLELDRRYEAMEFADGHGYMAPRHAFNAMMVDFAKTLAEQGHPIEYKSKYARVR